MGSDKIQAKAKGRCKVSNISLGRCKVSTISLGRCKVSTISLEILVKESRGWMFQLKDHAFISSKSVRNFVKGQGETYRLSNIKFFDGPL